MNTKKIIEAGVNYNEGLKRFSGNKELYEKYLVKFFEDSSISGLKECIQKGRYDEAFKYAHTMKGISGNLSLTNIYFCCCELVKALRNNVYDNLPELYNSLKVSYDTLKSVLTSEK